MTSEEQQPVPQPTPVVESTQKGEEVSQQEPQSAPPPTSSSSEQAQSENAQDEQQQHQIPEDQQQQQQPSEPEVSPALAAEGGREVSHKILYVGGLDKTISEDDLTEIFSAHGAVESVKILYDKNKQQFNYAFVEFEDETAAKVAFEALNGQVLSNAPIKINWAYQSQQAKHNPDHYNIFVGDLSTEIDDDQLRKAFSKFESVAQAHVMWDMQSGRSRGYGFVSFADQKDAEDALNTMNGEIIGNRSVRLNWASHKQQQHANNSHHNNQQGFNNHRGGNFNNRHHHHHNHLNGLNHNGLPTNGFAATLNGAPQLTGNPNVVVAAAAAAAAGAPIGANGLPINGGGYNGSTGLNMLPPLTYEAVLKRAPQWQTTVYVGNLANYTQQNELIGLLQNFGYIVDLKFHPDKSCAFVKYDSHERAAVAIVQLNGFVINNRPLKSGWGKDRSSNNIQYQNYGPVMYQSR